MDNFQAIMTQKYSSSLFTVDDHMNAQSKFLIKDISVDSDHVLLTYLINEDVDYESVKRLTVTIYDKSGYEKFVLDFDVAYDRVEHLTLAWEDPTPFLEFTIRYTRNGEAQ